MTVKVTISQTMRNEFWSRMPDHIPEVLFEVGRHSITEGEARTVLADAEFNADPENGPEDMPAGIRRAYIALAKQLRAAIAKAEGEA
jgi:hypothetical protein